MDLYTEAISRFQVLLSKALQSDLKEPTSVALATADKEGQPSVRMVLLKNVDEKGFVFYTNMKSAKGHQLEENPKAALCFYWPNLNEQVRVEGDVEEVTKEEADAYWQTRPRESQIGAWVSLQSESLASREVLLKSFEYNKEKFEKDEIPRPAYWSGYRIKPNRLEFWVSQPHRLHERKLYQKVDGAWRTTLLYP